MLERKEMNVLGIKKGDERFIFFYDDDSIEQLIEQLRVYAADPDISLNWEDASCLTRRVREMEQQHNLVIERLARMKDL